MDMLPPSKHFRLQLESSSRQQQPPPLLRLLLMVKTSSHSRRLQFCARLFPLRRLLSPLSPSSTVAAVMELLILPLSLVVFQAPLSPYWIPLMGSSGSISPNSILVKIMRASLPNISSTPSPLSALASVTTEIPAVLAHRLASALVTSRPSGAMVACCWVPALIEMLRSLAALPPGLFIVDKESEPGAPLMVIVEFELEL